MAGLTFRPGQDEETKKRGTTPVQEAIKILSLRLPRFVGGGLPAPLALLLSTALPMLAPGPMQGPGGGPGQPSLPGAGGPLGGPPDPRRRRGVGALPPPPPPVVTYGLPPGGGAGASTPLTPARPPDPPWPYRGPWTPGFGGARGR